MKLRLLAVIVILSAVALAVAAPFVPYEHDSRLFESPSHSSTSGSTQPAPISSHSTSLTVPFEKVGQGQLSGYTEALNMVINDSTTWNAVWERVEASCFEYCSPVPNVDFSSKMILAVFLGQEGSMSYTIEITHVQQTGNSIMVQIRVETVPISCPVAQTITEPFDIVEVSKTSLNVTFTTETIVLPCGG